MKIECFECQAPAAHAHHVIPRSLGGARTIPLCEKCHSLAHEKNMKISQLIRNGLHKRRAAGIKLGRPSRIDKERVLHLRLTGMSIGKIAKELCCSKAGVHKLLKSHWAVA